jgi:hypothetical protein
MKKFLFLALLACGCTNTPSTPSAINVSFSWSGGGCPIVITDNGANPVTETAGTGSAVIYSGLPGGNHVIAINANGNTSTCTVSKTGTISETNVCLPYPSVSCP